MSSTDTLQSKLEDRKSRLAKFKNLKRKQPEPTADEEPSTGTIQNEGEALDVTRTYLSGRNYDPETRGPKLGFENNPDLGLETLEIRAAALEQASKEEAAKDAKEENAQVDIFKLQPKKANWDLKRDLKERMEILDQRTGNAIARLVKERLEKQKAEEAKDITNGEESVPMEGGELLSAVHAAEQEAEADAQREHEEAERVHV